MNSLKISFGIALFFGIFLAALALHFSWEGSYDEASLSGSSQRKGLWKKDKKTSPNLQERILEPSKITSQTAKSDNELSVIFNDSAINQAWGLKKSDALRAWTVSQGSRNIVVAVIDTGVDINHEGLKENLWRNPGETGVDLKGLDKATNGIDDDGNGFVDDVYGWNFVGSTGDLTDNHGHGTHIAGIIGAKTIGIARQVSLMTLKYYDPKVPSTDNLKNTVNAIKYAVKMGANIINYSGGGLDFSQEEFDAVAEANKHGILFVAAAGNERSNSDQNHYYPADYKLPNIISVTAYNPEVEVLASSNYGTETVDLAAPGESIRSTLQHNTYGTMTGTSQATAFVSGAAALLMAHQSSFKSEDVKKHILKTGDAMASLANKTRTSRKLNLYKALTTLDEGIGATGVIAVNTNNLNGQFNSDSKKKAADANTAQSTSDMTNFGKHLLDLIGKPKPKRLGTKPPDTL